VLMYIIGTSFGNLQYVRPNRDGKAILKVELILTELAHGLNQRRCRTKTFLVDVLKWLRELTFYSDRIPAVHSCVRTNGVERCFD
jgi:hypothetical protein